jgi:protease I
MNIQKKDISKKVVLLIEELYEDLEAWYPIIRLSEENIDVVIAAPEIKIYHGKKGIPIQPDRIISKIREEDFDGIIIPGGFAPDLLRRYPDVLNLVKEFDKKNKLIAFICHAGWVPVSANIVKGRRGTSLMAIKDDMVNAGMIWEDKPVVIDSNFVTSRNPSDLGFFCKAIIKVLNE